jgi:hypothetical protein
MSWAQDGDYRAAPSATNFSADGSGMHRAVKLDASGNVVLCGAADLDFAGILQNDPAVGETATVKVRNVSKAVAGGAIAINDELTTDAAGRLVAATTGQIIVARPMAAASGTGVVIPVEIRPGGLK